MMQRTDATLLGENVTAMLVAAGMDPPKADVVAEVLVEVSRRVGQWRAYRQRVAVSRAHHTGALAAYLRKVTNRELAAMISCSTASTRRMAPFGGTKPMVTPNPQAYGFPTDGDPILIDISSSITTTTHTRQLAEKGARFPDAWALTAKGEPTDDPQEVTQRGGTLMPPGGPLRGHKGFSLALAIEVLSQGLSGHGRADAPKDIVLSMFIQVIDPEAFVGRGAFTRQTSHLAEVYRNNPPAPGFDAARVPGDNAAARRREALSTGVPIEDAVHSKLVSKAAALGVRWIG